ncbi:(Na+)-NQR maturation NqrM [Photobacterium sp. WH77]|uniref:(Na+)-NQR maturation NqrM n=2 Tax=Photobacterium TaxID=657 RepID=A0A0F5VBS2_9GAMM|nr:MULTISPECIES: (Na+)-NQR maturation NqrM [Photobacterium]KKC98949.1 Na(+)-translocating NADH-quinone reductase subunit E [Photobacterium halotolerans]MBD8511788.1 (Na+)-NQR maturation NqrM [Photobacterium arenosum]MBV7261508.1 (Na+)-NQR maturation NqrM [Photobacterium sp. WH24]MCG2836862.1 (Na+)-NQR maturation NqrM [Photobacterium sp. WH77]MCG2844529.1 (Na+)-NQR maturation NqrM [Photobacterium sp. WH80]
MLVYVTTFGVFLLVIVAMAVGYIFQRKTVAGSCGGLGAVGIEKECDCPEPCDKRLKREARAAKQEEWKKNQII